jgi:GntR family transcriptional regulator
MILRINPNDDAPVYAQIVQQVKFGVAAGAVRSGEQLPSVRELAAELRINPNTVARAYRELEYQGLVETQKGRGVFIAGEVGQLSTAQRLELLAERLDQLLHDAHRLGLTEEDLRQLLSERLEAAKNPPEMPPAPQTQGLEEAETPSAAASPAVAEEERHIPRTSADTPGTEKPEPAKETL